MYAPKQFREERRDVLLSAIASICFAALIVPAGEELQAAHLPMIAREEGDWVVVDGHVARGNPLWRAVGDGAPALAIFQGPQAYIHPGWLPSKRETGRAVPTWNYVAVHAHGRLSVHDSHDWLVRHVDALTTATEAGRDEPWAVADAPEGYIDQLARGIVGVSLHVERLEGAWKLAQHHPETNRLGMIDGLSAVAGAGAAAVAAAMRDLERKRTGR